MVLKGPVSVNSSGSVLLNNGRPSASWRRVLRTSASGHGSASLRSGFFFGAAAGAFWARGAGAVATTIDTMANQRRHRVIGPLLETVNDGWAHVSIAQGHVGQGSASFYPAYQTYLTHPTKVHRQKGRKSRARARRSGGDTRSVDPDGG